LQIKHGEDAMEHRYTSRSLVLVLALALLPVLAPAQTLKSVPRYDDADEYLPSAERKNADGVRLYLKQQAEEETLTAISDRSVSIKVIARIPEGAKAGVILFPGGSAQLSMSPDERLDRSFSFMSRSRDYYWPLGIATFLVDAPSDHVDKVGLTAAFRTTQEFSTDVKAIVTMIAKKFSGPLHLVGHSNGSISVANAANIPDLAVASYTLVSPIYRYADGSKLVTGANYTKPVQIVENREDACKSTQASGIDGFAKEIKAPHVKVSWVDGGKNELSGPCGPFSRHSFIGVEEAAVKAIADSF
jgi:hypothetical protein